MKSAKRLSRKSKLFIVTSSYGNTFLIDSKMLKRTFSINEDHYEFVYALQDLYKDEILKLRVDNSMLVNLNRDGDVEQGFIKRIY